MDPFRFFDIYFYPFYHSFYFCGDLWKNVFFCLGLGFCNHRLCPYYGHGFDPFLCSDLNGGCLYGDRLCLYVYRCPSLPKLIGDIIKNVYLFIFEFYF